MALIALPMYVNWILVEHGWSQNVALFMCALCMVALIVLLEQAAPRLESWRQKDGQLSNDLLFTVITLSVNVGVTALTELLVLFALLWVSATNADGGFFWPTDWPLFAQFFLALFIIEFARYWGHRLSHTCSFFWQFHAIHHSVKRLSVINLGRIHPGEQLPLIFAVVAIKLFGIPAEAVYWQGAFAFYMGLLAHCNVNLPTGGLDYIFNTPNIHRWHHSNKIHESNHNFCHALCLLDILFGSYYNPKGKVPRKLGIPMPFPSGFWQQMIYPLISRRKGRVIVAPESTAVTQDGATKESGLSGWHSRVRDILRPRRYTLELLQGGRVTMSARRKILNVFLDARQRYPCSCRIGECGACKSLLVSGSVRQKRYNKLVLTREEEEAGVFLACRASPLSDCVIAYGTSLRAVRKEKAVAETRIGEEPRAEIVAES